MAKGKRLTELEKFSKALEGIDFTKITEEEINTAIAKAIKQSKVAEYERQIEELKQRIEELNN